MINFILHLRPKKIPIEALKFRNTFGLGGITCFLFLIECITGILLMIYYTPSPDKAYFGIQKLVNVVFMGFYIRNLHRICGDLMIIFAFLHMVRVVFKKAYMDKIRRKNWKYGVLLFLLIFPLNFTGYMLPFDKVSYWGASVVLNAIQKIPLIGKFLIKILFSSKNISNLTLLRFYTYHIVILPVMFTIIFFTHIYYVRKAGGVLVKNFKNLIDVKELFKKEIILMLFLFFILSAFCLFFYSAPLSDYALTSEIPKSISAPWYFQNLQLLLMYLPPVIPAFLFPLSYIIYLLNFPKYPLKSIFFSLHFLLIFFIIAFKFLHSL